MRNEPKIGGFSVTNLSSSAKITYFVIIFGIIGIFMKYGIKLFLFFLTIF
jgi:hypothetical protein